MIGRSARVFLLLAAIAGLLLAALVFEWLEDPWDHCDYPEGCTGRFLPRAFMAVQWLWVLTLTIAGVGCVAALLARWSRGVLAVLALSWATLIGSIAITPMHWGGESVTMEWVEGNRFLWNSSGYGWVALAIALSSLAFGAVALRARSRSTARVNRPEAAAKSRAI